MKVLAISSRDLHKASTHYRIAQHVDFLKSRDVQIDFVKRSSIDRSFLKSLHKFDLVFNQKCLVRRSLARKIIAHSKRTIFDFDDAIYTRPGKP